MEPATALGRHDLLGIGRADRRQSIRIAQPGLEQRDLAIELHACNQFRIGQPELGHRLEREEALKGQIVNGKDRARSKAWLCRQEEGQEARVPVIGMTMSARNPPTAFPVARRRAAWQRMAKRTALSAHSQPC